MLESAVWNATRPTAPAPRAASPRNHFDQANHPGQAKTETVKLPQFALCAGKAARMPIWTSMHSKPLQRMPRRTGQIRGSTRRPIGHTSTIRRAVTSSSDRDTDDTIALDPENEIAYRPMRSGT